MINVLEDTEFDSIRNKAVEILSEQGYTVDYLRTYIASNIADDEHHGIELAYDSDYSNKVSKQKVLNFADDFIINYVYHAIADSGDDDDCIGTINDLLKEKDDEIKEFDREFEDLKERESSDYQSEINDLNRYYYSTRGV